MQRPKSCCGKVIAVFLSLSLFLFLSFSFSLSSCSVSLSQDMGKKSTCGRWVNCPNLSLTHPPTHSLTLTRGAAGVIVYIMLCGFPPFYDEGDNSVILALCLLPPPPPSPHLLPRCRHSEAVSADSALPVRVHIAVLGRHRPRRQESHQQPPRSVFTLSLLWSLLPLLLSE